MHRLLPALVVVSVSLAQASAAADLYRAAAGDRHKVRVTDPAVAQQILDDGGRLIADYGGFQVLEVNGAAHAAFDAVENRDEENRILLNAGEVDTTADTARALRRAAASFSGRRTHLVQFAGPVKPEWLDELTAAGVRIVTYIPHNAYLVYGDAAALSRVQGLAQTRGHVQWDGAYLDEDKIQPRAKTRTAAGVQRAISTDLFAIQLVDDPEANASTLDLVEAIQLSPIRRQSRVLGYLNVVVQLPPDQVAVIAAQPDVVSINTYIEPRKFDERQDQIVAGNLNGTGSTPTNAGYLAWLYSKGFTQSQFTASGFVVDVTDSGLDNGTNTPNHFGLYTLSDTALASRVVYNRLEGTPNGGSTIQGCDGHGTLNAHIIGGFNDRSTFPHTDSQGYRYGLGVCPFVKVGSSVIFDPANYTSPDYEDLISRAYRDGARISSDSWGADTAGDYDIDCQQYDALVRDAQPTASAVSVAGNQEMTIVFAAGNAGSGAQTVGSPGTAKNVITVGAAENVHSHSSTNGGVDAAGNDGCDTPDAEANSANDIASFSSRGPCSDLRKKPEIVAPGTHITGGVAQQTRGATNGNDIACFEGTGVCALPGGGTVGSAFNFFPTNKAQQLWSTSSGTSHSTPAVAGGCALIRQYFLNQVWSAPSPAMVKAFLMNAARYMTGTSANDTLWSNNQGLGMMNLGLGFDGTARVLRDQLTNDLFTATGQSRVFTGTISDTGKPFRVSLAWTDAPGATTGNAYKNNLDLVVSLGGQTYKGNVFSGQYSTNGGSADVRNNAEHVFLRAGQTGVVVVTVTAANINSDGVPNYGTAIDQDFALVIYNATAGASNQPPVLASIGNKSVVTNNVLSFSVSATDPFDGDTISLWATGVPPWAVFSGATNAGGVTNAFSGTAPASTGTWVTTFFAGDKDATNRETITISVRDIVCDSTNLITEGFDSATTVPAGWTDGGTANDTGPTHYQSSPNCRALGSGDTLTTPAADAPTQIVFYVDSSSAGDGNSGTIDYSVNGGSFESLGSFVVKQAGSNVTFVLTSSPNLSASTGVRFRFNSSFNTWYLDDVRVTGGCLGGSGAQTPPVLEPIGSQSVSVSNTLQFAVTATPSDGDTVTLTASNLPAGAIFSATNENGTFAWTNASPVGVYTCGFYAADNDGVDSETVLIAVNNLVPASSNRVVAYIFEDAGLAFTRAADSVLAGVTAGLFTSGDDVTTNAVGNPTYSILDTGFTGTNANYYQFALTIGAGTTVSVSSIRFDDRRSATGPSTWALRTSADSYGSDLASDGTHLSFSTNEATVSLDGLTGIVTFRLYGRNGLVGGTWRLDNVFLYGTAGSAGSGTLPSGVITTPDQTVGNAVATMDVSGTANTNVIGELQWTNSLSGGAGAIASATSWTISAVALSVGANVITVSGSNSLGDVASDSVTITRQSSGGGGGLTNILFQGFEPGDGWSIVTGSANISTNTGSLDVPLEQRIRTGSNSWQVINASNNLELASASVAGYTGRQVRVYLSSTANTGTQGAEATDVVRVSAALDGAAFPGTADLAVSGASANNARWGYWATNTLTTTAGTPDSYQSPQSGLSSNNCAGVFINLPDSSTSVALRVSARNNDTAERWNIDDIAVVGYGTAANPDSNGNGIPDSWESDNFGNLTNTAAGDNDGDGANNHDEYVADTCPTNFNARFELEAILNPDGRTLSFWGTNSRVYAVEYVPSLPVEGAWSNLQSGIPGTNGFLWITDTNEAVRRMYRGRVGVP